MCAYCGTVEIDGISNVKYTDTRFPSQTAYDNYVAGTLIPQVENLVDDYCGGRSGTLRRFNPNYGSLNLDGNSKSILYFPPQYTPILFVGTVTVDGTSVSTTTVKKHDQYLHYWHGAFNEGAQNIAFVGSFGYSAVPPTVSLVTREACANALLEGKRRKANDNVTGIGLGAVSYSTGAINAAIYGVYPVLTRELRNQLEPYRIRHIDVG